MKKLFTIFTLLLMVSFTNSLFAQVFSSDLEAWTTTVPNNWVGAKTTLEADSIVQYTSTPHGGSSAVQLINTESSHKRFTTQPVTVTNGTTYTITFWAKGHGSVRTGLFDGRATGSGYATYNSYILVNSATWAEYTQTIDAAKDTNVAEFIFSVQYTFADLGHLQIDDVNITGGASTPVINITAPNNGSTQFSSNVNVSLTVGNFVVGNPGVGIDGHIHYTVDGGSVVMKYDTNPIALTGLTAGSHTVKVELVDNTHTPLVPAVKDSVTFTVNLTPPAFTSIYDIQYTTLPTGDSPEKDSVVTTKGIVIGKYTGGYFIQDGNGAWSGLYIYDNVNQPVVGDSVLLTGKIIEYFNLTEMSPVNSYSNLGQGTLPTPTVVTATSLKTEQYEGVLVKIQNATCTDTNAGFGMWTVNDGTDTAKIHNLIYAYTPVLNHVYNVTGPNYYSFNEFRIEPRSINDVEDITGIESNLGFAVSIYPNPVVDVLTIESPEMINGVTIYNIAGQKVAEYSFNAGNRIKIDMNELPLGTYSVAIVSANGSIASAIVVK